MAEPKRHLGLIVGDDGVRFVDALTGECVRHIPPTDPDLRRAELTDTHSDWAIANLIKEVRAEERERCARMVHDLVVGDDGTLRTLGILEALDELAKRIREQKP
jgi:hypothetical protein